MKQTKKTINNHFIQKGFAKNFANNGIIKWTRYQPNENILEDQTFSINSRNVANQPIVKQNFHTQEIEDGMNKIEHHGVVVIRSITKKLNNNKNKTITLERHEIIKIKFFRLLSDRRTNKLRKNIEELSGDALFNNINFKDKRNPKDIHEWAILELIVLYEEYNEYLFRIAKRTLKKRLNITKLKNKKLSEWTNHDDFYWDFYLTLTSELIFFKFEENKLFLSEVISFGEKDSKRAEMYKFMPITPSIGIMFYYDLNKKGNYEDSKYFKTKISKEKSQKIECKYVSETNECKYIFKIKRENNKLQNILNGWNLSLSKNIILIYQDKKHIKDAKWSYI